ncbi:MAG: hypothetical protein R6X29_03770 [Acidimicrobiia bacterium]
MRWPAVALGMGAGLLGATATGVTVAGALAVFGLENGPDIGLLVGVVSGLAGAGALAGRLAPVVPRFHGSLAGLGVAAVVIVVARLGGSPASTPRVIVLALVAIVIGGIGGVLGGRR